MVRIHKQYGLFYTVFLLVLCFFWIKPLLDYLNWLTSLPSLLRFVCNWCYYCIINCTQVLHTGSFDQFYEFPSKYYFCKLSLWLCACVCFCVVFSLDLFLSRPAWVELLFQIVCVMFLTQCCLPKHAKKYFKKPKTQFSSKILCSLK